jgi:hypothetical protein
MFRRQRKAKTLAWAAVIRCNGRFAMSGESMPRKRRHILEDFETRSVAMFARWKRWLHANVGVHAVGVRPVVAPGLVLHRYPALPGLP